MIELVIFMSMLFVRAHVYTAFWSKRTTYRLWVLHSIGNIEFMWNYCSTCLCYVHVFTMITTLFSSVNWALWALCMYLWALPGSIPCAYQILWLLSTKLHWISTKRYSALHSVTQYLSATTYAALLRMSTVQNSKRFVAIKGRLRVTSIKLVQMFCDLFSLLVFFQVIVIFVIVLFSTLFYLFLLIWLKMQNWI